MIGSKMVLTYKRKRFSSRPGLGFENEGPDQSPGCQTLQVLKTPLTKEEEDSKHESERKDPEICNPCPVYSGGNLVSVSGQVNCESSLEAVGLLPLKGKSSSSCADTVKDNKAGFPLITFSRRSRHKKAVDVSGMQDRSTVVTNASNTTLDNGGLVDLSKDFTGNHPSQEKKASEDVDLHDVHSLPAPKIEIEIPTSEDLITERCISKDTTPTPTPITKPTSGILPIDAISHVSVLEDKQMEESECHVSAVDEGLESDRTTTKKRDGGSLASFDLSKPPPESSGLVDCNLTLESSSNLQPDNTHRDSTDSTSRSHSTVLHEFPCQQKVLELELLDERIGETPLSQLQCGPTVVSSSSSSHMWGPSASISQSQTSKNNFLQLFPEDRVKDLFPLKKPLNETSFIHHEDKQPNRRHLHFRTSTPFGLSPWPTIDTPGAHYPSDSVSLMRHKMMLDNIISKARSITGKKDSFDPPRATWSEDELDFLWIGVRRHGVGNWDSMIRDPRLHFAYSRSPRELAARWEEEHAKLLITKTPPQNKRSRPKRYEEPKLGLGSKGNLPHWLWEAVSVPPVSYTGHSGMMQWINQPFLGSVGPEPGGARLAGSREVNCGGGGGGKVDEVIVINSDASSEETISDHHTHSGR